MTPDALAKANGIQNRIIEAVGTRAIHLNAVKSVFKELSAADQATITATLDSIHTPIIAGLKAELAALDGDYTNPNAAAPTTVSPTTTQAPDAK